MIYHITDEQRKDLIDKYKPLLDACLEHKGGFNIKKTALIFAYNKAEESLNLRYGIRYSKDSNKVRQGLLSIIQSKKKPDNQPPKEETYPYDLCQIHLRTLPDCCGILLMNGGEVGLNSFWSPSGKKAGTYLWSTFCELIFEYAKLAGYGQVLATDRTARTGNLSKKLGVETLKQFKNPRTQNDISIYLKHIQ